MQPGLTDWYAWDGATQHGPLPLEEIRRRVAVGQLPPATQVKAGPNAPWRPIPAASPDALSAVGRAVMVGALTGLGTVMISAILLLIRYADPRLMHPLLGSEPKWQVGFTIATAVVARILASGPRRDAIAVMAAVVLAWLCVTGSDAGIALTMSIAVVVQLRPLHGLVVTLPAFLFSWAMATSGLDFGEQRLQGIAAALPVLLWLGLALVASVIARRYTPAPDAPSAS